jgi:hypothetical protein
MNVKYCDIINAPTNFVLQVTSKWQEILLLSNNLESTPLYIVQRNIYQNCIIYN